MSLHLWPQCSWQILKPPIQELEGQDEHFVLTAEEKGTKHFYPGPIFLLPTKSLPYSHKLWVAGKPCGFNVGPPMWLCPSRLPGGCGDVPFLHMKWKMGPRKPCCCHTPSWFANCSLRPAVLCS